MIKTKLNYGNYGNFSCLGTVLFILASQAACQWGVMDVGTPEQDADVEGADTVDGLEGDLVTDRVDDGGSEDIQDAEPETPCTSDDQCDDDEPCNGLETCGDDGFCAGGVSLDDGTACESAAGDSGRCRAGVCVTVGCGNGDVEGTEECDDGNMVPGDGCENDCTFTCQTNPECRDADACNGEEVCDPETHLCGSGTPPSDGFVCLADPRSICLGGTCAESVCGDGFVDVAGGEFCEQVSEPACRPDCTLGCAVPGDCPDDGNPCNGEEYCETSTLTCERRNPLGEGTECQPDPRMICLGGNCQASTCGDSFTDAVTGEECDDGNFADGDGCDNDCSFSCEVATQSVDCVDGLPCTDDLCIDATHTCNHPASGVATLCRGVAGPCDVEEHCNGTDTTCPADGFLAAAVGCRASGDICDVAESCTGSSAACPADTFQPGTVECRASAGTCDVAENCTGSSASCPVDAFQPSGYPCSDGQFCTLTEQCDGGGSCAGSGDPCLVWQLCNETADRCDAGLVINEFKVGGPDNNDEYIEIFNKKSVAVTIAGYIVYFRDVNGANLAAMVTFPAAATIAAGGYISVGRTGGDYAGQVDYTYTSYLSSGGGGIALYTGVETTGTRIDSVAYVAAVGTHPYLEGGAGMQAPVNANVEDSSVSRCPNGADTNVNSADFRVTTRSLALTNACP